MTCRVAVLAVHRLGNGAALPCACSRTFHHVPWRRHAPSPRATENDTGSASAQKQSSAIGNPEVNRYTHALRTPDVTGLTCATSIFGIWYFMCSAPNVSPPGWIAHVHGFAVPTSASTGSRRTRARPRVRDAHAHHIRWRVRALSKHLRDCDASHQQRPPPHPAESAARNDSGVGGETACRVAMPAGRAAIYGPYTWRTSREGSRDVSDRTLSWSSQEQYCSKFVGVIRARTFSTHLFSRHFALCTSKYK